MWSLFLIVIYILVENSVYSKTCLQYVEIRLGSLVDDFLFGSKVDFYGSN